MYYFKHMRYQRGAPKFIDSSIEEFNPAKDIIDPVFI